MNLEVPLRSQNFRDRAAFVFKRGVLGWGVVVAAAMYVQDFYKSGQWPPLSELGLLLAVFGAIGIPYGMMQMKSVKVRDPYERCVTCGEIVPNHTHWCAPVVTSLR